ncbi:hypothetical protein IPJ72_04030 [Candidatus Peregrinibacteria bacterium]|nr:MAG: hypothetical protein IPJ72_04030 [Candidatus Peregrinibacteria bacterium]
MKNVESIPSARAHPPNLFDSLRKRVEAQKKMPGTLEGLKKWVLGSQVMNFFEKLFTSKEGKKGFFDSLMGTLNGVLDWINPKERPEREVKAPPKSPEPQAAVNEHEPPQKEVVLPPLIASHLDVVSRPPERSKNGVTQCAKTARRNLHAVTGQVYFDVNANPAQMSEHLTMHGYLGIPWGDANVVKEWYVNNAAQHHLELMHGPVQTMVKNLDAAGAHFADVLLVRSYSAYGHRASAFKSSIDHRWYILDPYRAHLNIKTGAMERTQAPIPIEQCVQGPLNERGEAMNAIAFMVPIKHVSALAKG